MPNDRNRRPRTDPFASGTRSALEVKSFQIMSFSGANETYADAPLLDRTGGLAGAERRRNPRAPLHLTVYLTCEGSSQPLRSITRDINKDGFYCLLDQSVRPGGHIECDIVVPTHGSQDPDDVVHLRCRAQAVRVEKIGAGTAYGVACRIEDYCLIRGARPRLRFRESGTSSDTGVAAASFSQR